MAKNSEPIFSEADIRHIESTSNELQELVKPKSKNILADPVHEHGVFEQHEPELKDIKRILAQKEAQRQADIDERLKTARENAKKNSPVYIVDAG